MNQYENRQIQADTLALQVAEQLQACINEQGRAIFVVAGGSTPKEFLNQLSEIDLDWEKVTVLPSDERWVPLTDPRSNHRFISENLIKAAAKNATLVALYRENIALDQAVAALESSLSLLNNAIDVLVLGMGTDAHIASLFPGASNLSLAMDPNGTHKVCLISPPGMEENRISLSLSTLLTAKCTHLLIHGKDKLVTLHKAQAGDDVKQMPVRAILNEPSLQIHYAC